MPKILIIEACLVDFADDAGGQHQDVGAMPIVPKDLAADLVKSRRALYCDKADDFDKAGHNTASKEMLRAAAAMAQVKAKDEAPAA